MGFDAERRKSMKNFIKTNIKKLIISSLAILCPIIFGLIFWNELPELIAIHYGFSGEADGFGNKFFVVFGIPFILLTIHWLCMIMTSLDRKNQEQNPKALGIVFWIMPLASFFVSAMMYSVIFGAKFNFYSLIFLFIGVLFITVGNYMPKVKQNSTFGIKIKWTLINEENWNATHRLGGKLWFFGGIAVLFLALLPIQAGFIVLIPIIFIMVLIPTIYSCVYYKKQLKDGRATPDEVKKFSTKNNKLGFIITVIFVILTLAFCAFICFTGDFEFNYSDTYFTIKADYFDDTTVNYSDISSVEYRETDSRGTRVYGFGSPRLLMGAFRNDEFGNYTRYSYTKCNSCVVITSNSRVVVISGVDDTETKDIYNILIEKCN